MFIVERMPDAFHRKIKRLGFPDVDCVEFRLLDVEGTPAVCFESILRLRHEPVAAPTLAGGDNVIALDTVAAARATGTRLPKLVSQAAADVPPSTPRAAERSVPPRPAAPVVSMLSREPVSPPDEQPRASAEGAVAVAEAESAPNAELMAQMGRALAAFVAQREPAATAPAASPIPSLIPNLNGERVSLRDVPELSMRPDTPVRPAAAPEAKVSFKDLAAALLGPLAATQPATAPADGGLQLETPVAEVTMPLELETATPLVVEPIAEEPVVAPAMAEAVADLEPALTVEALIQSVTPTPVASPAARTATTPAPETVPPTAVPEFAGLKFPNDGVLTRQWMEFLSQMTSK
jgi:hypothetical protein